MSKAKKQKNANKHRALSAQQTIPYIAMNPDGICQLPGGLYTKTLEYEDINYAVASTEDQTAIISGWSACLNYFDSSLPFQLSFVNRRSRNANRYKVNIPAQEDDFNSIRGEYVEMLKGQIAKSNNGIERYKYITFGLPAEGVATWCYFDEFHILLRDPLTASYFVAVWKMLRKKGCVPSALTQNVKDLLDSREIKNILDNTNFMVLLSQALIADRMTEAGISNMGAYMRKIALNGYVLHVDLSDIRELVALQRRCANNLNQVAVHANTYGIYPSEIAALQKDYADLWEPLSELLKKLSMVVEL